MKVAFFTPLNPIQSGISDYSEELLHTLAGATYMDRPVQVDLFIDRGYKPSNEEINRRFHVLPGRGFGRVAEQYSSIIYQMGNSPAHAYIYEELLRNPGVVVMHEFVLHHLRMWMALNGGKRKAYMDLMQRRYGEEGREAARRVMLGQFPEALFNYPLSDEVIDHAEGIIVHSRYMEGLVRGVRSEAPLAVVPMGVPLPPFIPKEEARAYLGIDPGLFLVTSVGHLNPWKRVAITLRAFKALLMDVPNALYLLVGSRSPNYDPTRQIEMLGLQDHVRTTGYVAQADFAYYLAASDVCLNLRYPTAGETSASLLRIMGAGVPVLVSRTGSFEELPDDAVGKIDVGDIEEDLLLEYLLAMARKPELRAAMSASARRYVAEEHTLEGAARGYLRFLVGLQGGDAERVVVKEAGQKSEIRNQKSEIRNQSSKGIEHSAIETSDSKVLPVAGAGTSPDSRRVSTAPVSDLQAPATADPIGIMAEAAAEVGIEENDDAVLRYMVRAVEDLASDFGFWIEETPANRVRADGRPGRAARTQLARAT